MGTLGSVKAVPTRVVVVSTASAAVVRARQAVNAGVRVVIGTASREIEDDMPGASFWNVVGGIVSLRPAADETEPAKLQAEAEAGEAEVEQVRPDEGDAAA